MPEDNIKLTRIERLILTNQLRIMEVILPNEAENLATQREALERGYEMLYGWDMAQIHDGDDVMSREESIEVWDTLDLYTSIGDFTKSNFDPEITAHPFSKFLGYDGNNESKFMSFTAYTVERLHRFQSVPMVKKNYWNSHMPVRDIYKRMLNKWRQLPQIKKHRLSASDVKNILSSTQYE